MSSRHGYLSRFFRLSCAPASASWRRATTCNKGAMNMNTPSLRHPVLRVSALALLAVLSACSKQEPAAPPVAETEPTSENALAASIDGDWRSADDRSRDEYRHPQQAL